MPKRTSKYADYSFKRSKNMQYHRRKRTNLLAMTNRRQLSLTSNSVRNLSKLVDNNMTLELNYSFNDSLSRKGRQRSSLVNLTSKDTSTVVEREKKSLKRMNLKADAWDSRL